MDIGIYNTYRDQFCKLIKLNNPEILEIGCGPGNITKYLLSKRADFNITSIDVAPNMIELAKKNNPTVQFKLMDCRNINSITKKYDALLCGFCIPYLSKQDCSKLIIDTFNLLNDNGIFYFSMIEGNYNDSGYTTGSTGDQMYIYFYNVLFFKKKLIENNFKLIELHKVDYPINKTENETHLIFIAKKMNSKKA